MLKQKFAVTISISWEFSEAMLKVIFSLGKDPHPAYRSPLRNSILAFLVFLMGYPRGMKSYYWIAKFVSSIAALIAAVSLLWIAVSVSKASKAVTSAVAVDGLRVSVGSRFGP
jgi:hypothetical protein